MIPLTTEDKQRIFSYLESHLEPSIYGTWCRSLELERVGENSVRVPAANGFYREWLERILRQPLEQAFQSLFGRAPDIIFHVTGVPMPPAPVVIPMVPPSPTIVPAIPAVSCDITLNPAYTFEHFVAGPSNRVAYSAALAVSERPATLYNPLFIHGGVGLGKTHLLQAICHATLARDTASRVIYTSCEDFVNAYVSAIQKNRMEAFRTRYRSAAVLVVDDIHFLAAKEGSQEEFFHTFNALHLAGRQVVLSSDQPARDIKSVKEHLLSRFKMGFDTTILPPTYETRLAVLQRKAETRGWVVSGDVLTYVAETVQTNMRELEGALTKVVGVASLAGRVPDLALARDVLCDVSTARTTSLSLDDIQTAVAKYFNRPLSEFRSRRWTKASSQARQICMYVCRELTSSSLQELGRSFGGKNHATVLYSIHRVEQMIAQQPNLRTQVERIIAQLKSK